MLRREMRLILAGLLLGAFLAPQAALAAPSGEDVLDNYIKVTGGKDAHDKIKSRVVIGKMSIPKQGLDADINLFQKSPNLSYMAINLTGIGAIERGFNGTVGWEKSPMTGVRILAGEELVQLKREATINAEIAWRDMYEKAENVGTEQIDGKNAYKLEMTSKTGQLETRYYDVESGLLLQTDMIAKTAQGDIPVTAIPSDWKDVDGLKMPMKTTQTIKSMGLDQIITFEKIDHNTDVPDAKFDLPADVKALIEKAPATQPAK